MSERHDFECGCVCIKVGGQWYQVVSCPLHVMDMRPMAEPSVTARSKPATT